MSTVGSLEFKIRMGLEVLLMIRGDTVGRVVGLIVGIVGFVGILVGLLPRSLSSLQVSQQSLQFPGLIQLDFSHFFRSPYGHKGFEVDIFWLHVSQHWSSM